MNKDEILNEINNELNNKACDYENVQQITLITALGNFFDINILKDFYEFIKEE